jgi:hypothetical protein
MIHLKPLRTVLVALAAATVFTVSASAQGKVEVVGGETFDWGKVAPGELKTTIELRNVGTDTLKIDRVQPGCGCTAAPIDKNTLAPGEIGKISVTLDAKNRSGALHKIITVYSNDSVAPAKVINLTAEIKPVMEFRPTEWFLVNEAKVGAETASSIRLVNTGDAPFTVFPPEMTTGNFRVRFNMKEKQEVQPGQEIEITAFVTPQAAGAMNGTIRLKTTTKEYPTKELTVYGNVIAAAPEAPKPAEQKSIDISSTQQGATQGK